MAFFCLGIYENPAILGTNSFVVDRSRNQTHLFVRGDGHLPMSVSKR
jgi:hypothetical protein